MNIDELQKPRQQWCEHCDIGVGCTIYDTKPPTCSGFYCSYLVHKAIGEEWRPSACGIVLHYDAPTNCISIHVDEDRKDAWREEPFYSQIKNWAVSTAAAGGYVLVWAEGKVMLLTRDSEIDAGPVRSDQSIVLHERPTAFGVQTEVLVLDRDDPLLTRK
jgi:hypothetical protein